MLGTTLIIHRMNSKTLSNLREVLAGEKGWKLGVLMAQMLAVMWAMCANKRNIFMRFNTNRTTYSQVSHQLT